MRTLANRLTATRLRSTIGGIIGVLAMFGPDVLTWLASANLPAWASGAAKALGLLVLLATNGKAVALLNVLIPAEKPQAAPTPASEEVTKPEGGR